MVTALPSDWTDPLRRWAADGRRRLLGLVGPPGCGKSTLAQALVDALPRGAAVVVPMDGYHLANDELARQRRAGRKGAPETFDAAGYLALLQRLRRQPAGEVVYAPAFRRELDQAVAGAIAVDPGVPLVITEGNYLLLKEVPWCGVRRLLDQTWYLALDDAQRRRRLLDRHRRFGRSAQAAQAWIDEVDEPNARLIADGAARADRTLRWPDADGV